MFHDVTFAHSVMLFMHLFFGHFRYPKHIRNDKHYKVFRKSDSRCDFCTQCNAFHSLFEHFTQKMLIFCNPSNAFRMCFHWFAKPYFTNGIPMISELFSEKMWFSIFATPLMVLEDFSDDFSWNFVNLGGKVTVVPRFRFFGDTFRYFRRIQRFQPQNQPEITTFRKSASRQPF